MNDFLEDFYISAVGRKTALFIKQFNHVCGFCKFWKEFEDGNGYGDCDVVEPDDNRYFIGYGFDCERGKECRHFEPFRKLVVSVEVVEQ